MYNYISIVRYFVIDKNLPKIANTITREPGNLVITNPKVVYRWKKLVETLQILMRYEYVQKGKKIFEYFQKLWPFRLRIYAQWDGNLEIVSSPIQCALNSILQECKNSECRCAYGADNCCRWINSKVTALYTYNFCILECECRDHNSSHTVSMGGGFLL